MDAVKREEPFVRIQRMRTMHAPQTLRAEVFVGGEGSPYDSGQWLSADADLYENQYSGFSIPPVTLVSLMERTAYAQHYNVLSPVERFWFYHEALVPHVGRRTTLASHTPSLRAMHRTQAVFDFHQWVSILLLNLIVLLKWQGATNEHFQPLIDWLKSFMAADWTNNEVEIDLGEVADLLDQLQRFIWVQTPEPLAYSHEHEILFYPVPEAARPTLWETLRSIFWK